MKKLLLIAGLMLVTATSFAQGRSFLSTRQSFIVPGYSYMFKSVRFDLHDGDLKITTTENIGTTSETVTELRVIRAELDGIYGYIIERWFIEHEDIVEIILVSKIISKEKDEPEKIVIKFKDGDKFFFYDLKEFESIGSEVFIDETVLTKVERVCVWTTNEGNTEFNVQRSYVEETVRTESGHDSIVYYKTIDCLYNDVNTLIFQFVLGHNPESEFTTLTLYNKGGRLVSHCSKSVRVNPLNSYPIGLKSFTAMSDRRIKLTTTIVGLEYQWVSGNKEHLNLVEIQRGGENFLIK